MPACIICMHIKNTHTNGYFCLQLKMDWCKVQRILQCIRTDDHNKLKELTSDCDVNSITLFPLKDTPLQYACRYGSINVAKFLIHQGTDVNNTGAIGVSPLIMCIRNDACAMLDLLCSAGSHVNVKSTDGRSSLSWCLFCPRTIDIAKFNLRKLCEYGLHVGVNSEHELNESLELLEDSEQLRMLLESFGFIPRIVTRDRSLFTLCIEAIREILIIPGEENLFIKVQHLRLPPQVKSALLLGFQA